MDYGLLSSNFRYKYISLLVVLVFIILALMFGTLPDISLFWRELQNTGHTILFILIAILILLLLRGTSNFFWQKSFKLYITAFFISLLIGIVIEIVQSITHSDASKMDIVRDLAGIIIGLGLYASTDSNLPSYSLKSGKWIKAGIVTLSFCSFTASMLPLAFLSVAYVQRETAFPVVVDLTANWIQPFLRLKNAAINIPEGRKIKIDGEAPLTRVDFKRGIYPGVSIVETSPDWSAYKALTIVIYSKLIKPFDLTLRIHDDKHNYSYADRFNTALTINKGTNYFHIPLEDVKKAPMKREMDMLRIKEIIIFSAQSVEKLHFYIGKMRLK